MTDTQTAPDAAEDSPNLYASDPIRAQSTRSLLGWVGMPLFLAVVLGSTYFWIQGQDLDSIESRVINRDVLTDRTIEHLKLVGASTLIVILIAIPVGVILTRHFARRAIPFVLAIANGGQAIPSLGLITIIVLLTSPGFQSVVIGLVAYSALPILRNTMVGLNQVDVSLIKASRGMGLSPLRVLFQVELPLAIPVMIAGIRTALIINVGTAALAFLFGAGGLGFVIFTGINLNRDPMLIVGVVLVSGLALSVDYLAGTIGFLLSPKGL